jgi:phenylalanyl-tRNA synthetase alpha subunit
MLLHHEQLHDVIIVKRSIKTLETLATVDRRASSPTVMQHATNQHSTNQHATNQHATNQHSTNQHSTNQHATTQHSTNQSRIDFTLPRSSCEKAARECLVYNLADLKHQLTSLGYAIKGKDYNRSIQLYDSIQSILARPTWYEP